MFLFGVFAFEALAVIRREQPARTAIICGLAMVPNLVWRGVVQIVTGESLTRAQIFNMDFPLFGFVKAFAAVHDVTADDVFVIVVLVFMLAFLIIVAFCILRWRQWDGLAAGWLVLAAVMLCMACNRIANRARIVAPGLHRVLCRWHDHHCENAGLAAGRLAACPGDAVGRELAADDEHELVTARLLCVGHQIGSSKDGSCEK